MIPLTLLLLAAAVSGCRSLAGSDTQDNPNRISPTSMTGVTSDRGTNVYAKVPASTSAAR
jgi:hypothetical protein